MDVPPPEDLVAQLLAALDERGAPEAIALAELMRVEQSLSDSLRVVRRLIDAIVRRTSPDDIT